MGLAFMIVKSELLAFIISIMRRSFVHEPFERMSQLCGDLSARGGTMSFFSSYWSKGPKTPGGASARSSLDSRASTGKAPEDGSEASVNTDGMYSQAPTSAASEMTFTSGASEAIEATNSTRCGIAPAGALKSLPSIPMMYNKHRVFAPWAIKELPHDPVPDYDWSGHILTGVPRWESKSEATQAMASGLIHLDDVSRCLREFVIGYDWKIRHVQVVVVNRSYLKNESRSKIRGADFVENVAIAAEIDVSGSEEDIKGALVTTYWTVVGSSPAHSRPLVESECSARAAWIKREHVQILADDEARKQEERQEAADAWNRAAENRTWLDYTFG